MKAFVLAVLFATTSLPSALAGTLARPTGEIILTITGDIANTNAEGAALFDSAMLQAIAGRRTSTETPWAAGITEFEGPLLRAVLEAAGADGKHLVVKALNDYSSEVPIEDAQRYDTILAMKMNGVPMTVRDKGPVFLIYPFDTNRELYNEKYFSRSVWQIREIEVRD